MVEFQPSKLAVAGSSPVARSNESLKREEASVTNDAGWVSNGLRLPFHTIVAHVAQLAEHVLGKDEVTRSIRVVGSIILTKCH